MAEERLQKLISQAGIVSRRAAEDLIRQGRVSVNGRPAQLGEKADLARDEVKVDGVTLRPPQFAYYLLYKPRNVVSTNRRMFNERRPLVRELIPHEGHLFTVGRLDADSEGLILLTNDGELADRLMHPRYGHTKTYHVWVVGRPLPKTLEAWRNGVVLDGERTAPAKVRQLEESGGETLLEIVMREGRKRQIRNVASLLGHPVKRLIRVKIDFLEIGHLRPGQWRTLSPAEVRQLKARRKP
ncbi:MAG: rRNA pseudouridine synthase [Anaerolineae bacterium]|nr:rRNA pseudouridine synthase [Anaerolineae bacterium]MEB2287427.1 pseudouridine synthase [Anaerolineae bacterium]